MKAVIKSTLTAIAMLCCFFIPKNVAAKTYAVVIGIAKYQNPALPALQYSDKDAGLFAAYLQSKAGGSIPPGNIKLLQNDRATIAAIYNALDWLKAKCGKNDVAYIYFSGHGDVETKNAAQKGYLLAWNTPPNNYVNNAISIENLNEAANTLTIKNGAKVILITDACHSGKLAGDFFKGKQLAARQLSLVLNNAVRLAACKTDQEAAEGPDWGGGRGVFSYYLLSGLSGDADIKKDGNIQLWEISRFLDSALTSDKYLLQDKHRQNPLSDGNPDFSLALAVVGETLRTEIQTASGLSGGLMDFDAVEVQPIDYFFATAKAIPLEQILDFTAYHALPPESLPLQILTDCLADTDKIIRETPEAVWSGDWNHWFYTLKTLKAEVQKNPLLAVNFNEKLVQLVQDKAQEMINAYLTGDVAELEKRQYYGAGNWQYGRLLDMLHTVMPLVPESHYLHRVLETDDYYLSGLIARLGMAIGSNADSLLNRAFYYQQRAQRMEPYAAYINNELGNLFLHKKNYDSADARFHLASVLAPTWAIPWANKIRLNLAKNDLPQARAAIQTADSLQPNLAFVLTNAGLVMEKDSNWLAAESYYLKAIKLNNVHYLPYERLAGIYGNTGRYDSADFYAFQASIRKEQYAVNDVYFFYGIEQGGGGPSAIDSVEKLLYCDGIPSTENASLLPYTNLIKILEQVQAKPAYADTAVQVLRRILQQEPDIPLAHHALGKILYQQGKGPQAMAALQQAITVYRPNAALKTFLRKKFLNRKSKAGCLPGLMAYFNYDILEDYYLLGALYEKQKAWSKAVATYTAIAQIENERQKRRFQKEGYEETTNNLVNLSLSANPDSRTDQYFAGPVKTGGALKLALLHEKRKDYKMAEKTWLVQVAINRKLGRKPTVSKTKPSPQADFQETVPDFWLDVNRDFEAGTYSFYNRMMGLFPRDYQCKEAAGLFLYRRLGMAFGQVEPKDFYTTHQGILADVYPFAAAEKRAAPDSSVYFLPGTGERLVIDMPVYDPAEQALRFLQQSIALSPEVQPRRPVAEAAADLAAWYGNTTEAVQGYRAILQRQPADDALRLKLLNYLLAQSELTAAYPQLDTLYQKKYLYQEEEMLLAQYHILSGKYDKASRMLQNYHPQTEAEAYRKANLLATMYCLQGNPQKALPYLQQMAVQKPASPDEDTTEQHRQNIFRLYTLARVYATQPNNDAALTALQQALDAGFTFKYVLDNDAVWQSRRNTEQWKTLVGKYDYPNNYSTERVQRDNYLSFRTPWK